MSKVIHRLASFTILNVEDEDGLKVRVPQFLSIEHFKSQKLAHLAFLGVCAKFTEKGLKYKLLVTPKELLGVCLYDLVCKSFDGYVDAGIHLNTLTSPGHTMRIIKVDNTNQFHILSTFDVTE